jgi:hypothetical protein
MFALPFVAAAGAAMSAVGAISSGNAQAAALRQNAALETANANAVNQQTSQRQQQELRQGRQAIGEQSASIAQSGIGFSGTGNDLLKQSATNLDLDVLNTGYAGQLQSMGLENQAAIDKSQASSAITAGWIGTGSSLLKGVGSYAQAGGKF